MHSLLRRSMLYAMGAAVALSTSLPAFAQKKIELTYATYLPKSFTFVQVDDWFMQEITRRTEGRVTFKTYYGASLLKALDVFPGLKSGAADLATGAPGYNVDLLPLSSVIQPYITEKADAAVKAFLDLYRQNDAFKNEWEKNNMRLVYPLAAVENTIWSRKPVRTAADLKGMRIRATLGVAQSLNMLGATPVALGMQDGVEALKRGAIDGFASSPFDLGVLVGLHEAASYAGDAGRMGVYGIIATAFNMSSWNRLPEDVRKVIDEVATEVPAKYLEITNAAVRAAADKVLATKSLEVVRPTEEENARWKAETAQAVWDKWLANMKDKGLDGKPVLDKFIELVRKYEPQSGYTPGFDIVTGKK
ncbi:MAG: TRAP transporter substrate-binding protein DctP [Burkholderiaceae bacterium]